MQDATKGSGKGSGHEPGNETIFGYEGEKATLKRINDCLDGTVEFVDVPCGSTIGWIEVDLDTDVASIGQTIALIYDPMQHESFEDAFDKVIEHMEREHPEYPWVKHGLWMPSTERPDYENAIVDCSLVETDISGESALWNFVKVWDCVREGREAAFVEAVASAHNWYLEQEEKAAERARMERDIPEFDRETDKVVSSVEASFDGAKDMLEHARLSSAHASRDDQPIPPPARKR